MPRISNHGTHYTDQDVTRRLAYGALARDRGVDRAVFLLARGDTAWNPASTSSLIHGPARVEFTRYPDGGINAHVADLTSTGGH